MWVAGLTAALGVLLLLAWIRIARSDRRQVDKQDDALAVLLHERRMRLNETLEHSRPTDALERAAVQQQRARLREQSADKRQRAAELRREARRIEASSVTDSQRWAK